MPVLFLVFTFAGIAGVRPVKSDVLETKFTPVRVTSDPEVRSRVAKAGRTARALGTNATTGTSRPIPIVAGPTRSTGMSGTYHIPGDFATIQIAVATLNLDGVSGPTTWILDSASYTEAAGTLTFGNFPGAGTATVTIQPKAGVAVTVNITPSASEGKGFAFNNAQGITIDGVNSGGSSLTLQYSGGTFPSSDPFGATIYVTNGSEDITVTNTTINGTIQTSGTFYDQTDGRPAVFSFHDSGDVAGNNNVTIDGCTIINATFAIKVLSDYTSASALHTGTINFTDNHIGGGYGGMVSHGGLLDVVDQIHFDGNVYDGIEFVPVYWENGATEYNALWTFADSSFLYDFGQPSAGHFYNIGSGSTCSYNWVKDSHQNYNDGGFGFIIYGFYLRIGSASAIQVHDNRIEGVHTTDADGTDAGLRSEFGAYHNSIRFTGTQTAGQVSYTLRAAAGNFYNNALSNERTGAAGANIRCLQGTPVGNSDGNAFYSSTGRISSGATLASYFATGKDTNSIFGPVNFSADLHIAGGPSSAENIGRPNLPSSVDIDGTPRDTTAGGSRDAGADEFINSGVAVPIDVFPVSINPPDPLGAFVGINHTPVVRVKNNSNSPIATFNVALSISGGYNQTASISLNSRESKSVSFPIWTPLSAGSYTISAMTLLGSDTNAANDSLSRQQLAFNPDLVIGDTLFDWDTGTEGWTATGDFVRSNSFTKLSGPYSGYAWVTKTTGNYTNATANILTSPWLNLASIGGDGNVYLSFYQSLQTEPSRDRSWMQYSTDGITWKMLGTVNDPNGINWYGNSCVYENGGGNPDCWDVPIELLAILGYPPSPPPGWTSNGDCTGEDIPTGPDGYVYCYLKVTPANYPDIIGSQAVQFRFVAFADAGTSFEGWAIDNFRIGGAAPVLMSPSVYGKVYDDLDGSGTRNGVEVGIGGIPVQLKYYGCLADLDTTDGNGDYSLNLSPPGLYTVQIITSRGISQPPLGHYSINYTGNFAPIIGKDFGLYEGSISGTVFEDENNNGLNDEGIPLSTFIVEARKDSCNGPLYGSDTSGLDGSYSIPAGPGTFYVSQKPKSGFRQSYPSAPCHTVVIAGPSGSGTSFQTGIDFGNFKANGVKVSLLIDENGNGIQDAGDTSALPSPLFETFSYSKNGITLAYDTLGMGTFKSKHHPGADTGTYVSSQAGGNTAGWIHTTGGNTLSALVSTSGDSIEILHLAFKLINAGGIVFEDLNGNGLRDSSEALLSGWQVNVNGARWADAETSAITSVGGSWSADSIPGGAHSLTLVLPSGWAITSPPSLSYYFSGMSGQDHLNRDWGVYFIGGEATITDTMRAGWNLVSVPLLVPDYAKSFLYPGAVSGAFAYSGVYTAHDPLFNDAGFWIKYPAPESVHVTGFPRLRDTMDVNEGWNLVGSFSLPISSSNVLSLPAGMNLSRFFGYNGIYFVADTLVPGMGYWIKTSLAGKLVYSPFVNPSPPQSYIPTAVRDLPLPPGEEKLRDGLPSTYALAQNYPNPFNPSTIIRYDLPEAVRVTLSIFNVLGQQVAVPVDELQNAGYKSIEFDARNSAGSALPSGIYFYKLTAGTFVSVRKMMLIR